MRRTASSSRRCASTHPKPTESPRTGIWSTLEQGLPVVPDSRWPEATAVRPEGRISPWDQGLWSDAHVDALRPITAFISSQGSVPAVQLAHAGRKASTAAPWIGTGLISEGDGGWQMVAPSALPYDENLGMPEELSTQEISEIIRAFGDAAARAIDGGYRVIELHLAHGYLGCEFLSPLSNLREDEYGGSLEGRSRFALDMAAAVRSAIPDSTPRSPGYRQLNMWMVAGTWSSRSSFQGG